MAISGHRPPRLECKNPRRNAAVYHSLGLGLFRDWISKNAVFRCSRYVALPAIIPHGRGEGERFIHGGDGDVGYSVSQARISWKVPYSDSKIQLERLGNAVFCHGNVKFTSSGQCNYSTANEILPEGFRPLQANTPAVFSFAGNFALLFDKNGKVTMLGNPNSAYVCCTGSWITGDTFPA